MPIGTVARQARYFQADHDSCLAAAHGCNQIPEGHPCLGDGCALAFFVNHHDPFFRPAGLYGPIRHLKLPPSPLDVVPQLLRRRLTDVDERFSLQMLGADPGINLCHRHRCFPFPFLHRRPEPAIAPGSPPPFGGLLRETRTTAHARAPSHPAIMCVVDPWDLLHPKILESPVGTIGDGQFQSRWRSAPSRAIRSRTASTVNTEPIEGGSTAIAGPALVHVRGIFIVEPSG